MTIAETLIASAITLTLMGSVLAVMAPVHRLFDTQPEFADMHQRTRVGVTVLMKDLLGAAPPVMPYRIGLRGHDPDAGIFYRTDTITLVPPPWDLTATTHTYYLKNGGTVGKGQLMRYDGNESDVPVVDHLAGLAFEYLDAAGVPLASEMFLDGPWFPDAADRTRFDRDLLRIKRVRVRLRIAASTAALRRLLPDREVTFEITPRNASHE